MSDLPDLSVKNGRILDAQTAIVDILCISAETAGASTPAMPSAKRPLLKSAIKL